MAGARKGNTNRYVLNIPAAAAGTAADVIGDTLAYDPFAEGGLTAGGPGNAYDQAAEEIQEMALVTYAILTGQITNFVSLRVTHRNAAGTIKNQFSITFDAAGKVTAAFVPLNLGVASGAVVVGAGTATLTVGTGVALPWTLVPGDTITLDRLSNNATGLATPAASLTFLVAGKGS